MKVKLIVNNSFSDLEGFNEATISLVDQLLTTHNEIHHEREYLEGQISWLKKEVEEIGDENPRTIRIYRQFRKKLGFAKKRLKDLIASEFVHHLHGSEFPTGHLSMVRDLLKELHIDFELEDRRAAPGRTWEPYLCKDFHEPRCYQREAHEAAMREGRGVIESAVGTGKTDMMMRLVHDLGVTSLIVVPSRPLLEQLQPILEEHFGTRQVTRLGSGKLSATKLRKLKKKPIRVVTIHQLAAARKKGTLATIIDDVGALFIDEIHHAGSKSYTDLMEDFSHIYHRYGFTGTFLRNDSKILDLWGFLSTVLYRYPAWRAIQDGFLTPVQVISHELGGIEKRMYQSEYRANYCGGKRSNPEELLTCLEGIFKNYVKEEHQVLILVNRKDQCGKILHEFLDELGVENTYISGDSKDAAITDAIKAFNEKKVRVLIGSQVIGEGIDIRTADHLIMAQGGKSEIAIVQAAGRLVRLSAGKTTGFLHDFRFRETKYMEKHWRMRKDIYKRNLAPLFKTAA